MKLIPDSVYVDTAITATITPFGFKNWYKKVSVKFTGFRFFFLSDDFENEISVDDTGTNGID